MATETTVVTYHLHSSKLAVEDLKRPSNLKSITVTRRRLLLWDELAEWQKADSKLIQSGYREATPSLQQCVQSWFYLHNETVNILTHLGGSVLFTFLAIGLYHELSQRYASWSVGDIVACAIFMFGVAICFAFSAAFHTCASHSKRGYDLARQLDFQGIIILVLSTSAPQVYYTFLDRAALRSNYWLLISFFGVLASVATFTPTFYKPGGSAARAAVFAGLGLSTFAPVVHGVILHGWAEQSLRFPLWVVGLTHTFNILGAIVYVLHFPECWWPRKFDLIGSSHQLMHCAIIGAALTLLVGTLIAFDHANNKAEGTRIVV